jgi:hypothetical protein
VDEHTQSINVGLLCKERPGVAGLPLYFVFRANEFIKAYAGLTSAPSKPKRPTIQAIERQRHASGEALKYQA